MYKVYSDHNETFILVATLEEVRELTGATNEQISKLHRSKVLTINGFPVINYARK